MFSPGAIIEMHCPKLEKSERISFSFDDATDNAPLADEGLSKQAFLNI